VRERWMVESPVSLGSRDCPAGAHDWQGALEARTRSGLLDTHPKRPTVGVAAVRAPQGSGANGLPLERRAPYLFSASVVFVAQTASLSVSPEIVAAREDFFNHGWTRINTDEDGFS